MPRALTSIALMLALGLAGSCSSVPEPNVPPELAEQQGLRVEVSFPASLEPEALDGRLLLILSTSDEAEPRFLVRHGPTTQLIFGIDVNELGPGEAAVFDADARGYPLESLAELPPGRYWAQAVLNRYTTFTRADGHTIQAHMDQGEGQRWNISPGNLISEPVELDIDSNTDTALRVELSTKIPPLEPPLDTEYVKHLRVRSELLSQWWGREIELGAIVVVPPGFDEHPEARYPVAYLHGHYPATFNGFREQPPGDELEGRARERAEGKHRFYLDWVAGRLPKFLIVLIQHPTPFYDDSYAVNSANSGPYGDALTKELIPHVEQQFRALAQPWARVTFGGSTGGWESLAWQIFYPDMFNGVWSFCPDPVDFHYFQLTDIYADDNAFYPNSEWKRSPIHPWKRGLDDRAQVDLRDACHLEAVLGTRGRSGGQMDVFMATFGPVGDDGYPRLLYDKWTGELDHEVAEHWREHYDLNHILQRDWAELGPKLVGKLHVYMGDMDTYFLEEAVFLLRDFLEGTSDPAYDGSFDIGPRQPHCYSGMPAFPGQSSTARVLPLMEARVLATAPPGADVSSWRY